MKKGIIALLIVSSLLIGGIAGCNEKKEIKTDTNVTTFCAKEGEQVSRVLEGQYLGKCCGNLTEWYSGFDSRISVGNKCYDSGILLEGTPVGTCINCGNSICENIEDACNCPQDCKNGENSDYADNKGFCADDIGKRMAECQ